MHNSQLKLVCFDLGGVIVRICRTWQEACFAAGLDLRDPWRESDASIPAIANASAQFSAGHIPFSAWADAVHDAIGGTYSIDEITAIHGAILLGEHEGVGEVIDRIHAAGLSTASLSNTDAQHWPVLEQFPAIARLHHRHASHLLRACKPDPQIYQSFQQRVSIKPNKILFLDDLPANVEAAHALGWNAELIDPFNRTDVQIERAVQRFASI